MRATKKRAEVLYKVLLKHFSVDDFMLHYNVGLQEVQIWVRKNGTSLALRPWHGKKSCVLTCKWLADFIYKHRRWNANLNMTAVASLDTFLDFLKNNTYTFAGEKPLDLAMLKLKVVQTVLNWLALAHHYCLYYEWTSNYMPRSKIVYRIDNIEQLVIEEELASSLT